MRIISNYAKTSYTVYHIKNTSKYIALLYNDILYIDYNIYYGHRHKKLVEKYKMCYRICNNNY